MTITTKKKDLTHNCSKEFHDLFHPYPEPRYSNTPPLIRADGQRLIGDPTRWENTN